MKEGEGKGSQPRVSFWSFNDLVQLFGVCVCVCVCMLQVRTQRSN